jgi:hypothetical protein
MKVYHSALLLLLTALISTPNVLAGKADVVDTKVDCPDRDYCNFSVTLSHADEGWNHYADSWEVLAPDRKLLGTRKLLHPHVHEQPFTRSLSHVAIPGEIDRVYIRAHDSVHGYSDNEMEVMLPTR